MADNLTTKCAECGAIIEADHAHWLGSHGKPLCLACGPRAAATYADVLERCLAGKEGDA